MSSKPWRWTKRILLGLLAFIVVAVGVVLAVLHTDWGRDVARKQIEARLNDAFIGGAKIGGLEGSVVGNLVLRDVVLNGPDKKPAITIKKLQIGVGILPLFSKQVRIANLRAEDIDIDIRRDPDGQLQTSRMLKPGPKSGFTVVIPDLVVERAHVRVQGMPGAEDTNIDNIHISGDIDMPAEEPLEASLLVMAHWRERNAPIWLDTTLENGEDKLTVPSLIARLGDVHVVAAGVHVVKPSQARLTRPVPTKPVFSGFVSIDATKRGIEQLAPNANIPVENIDLIIAAAPLPLQPWTSVTINGTIDGKQIYADIEGDLDAMRARGFLATDRVDLTKLSNGKLQGQGAIAMTFDGRQGKPGALPIGNAIIHATGDIADIDNAVATIAVNSNGERATTTIAATARGSSANIGASVRKQGDRMVLEASRVIAKVRDPSRVTGGKAPVHGTLAVDLTASGALSPKPDLAVTGRVFGSRLRAKDLKIRTLKVAVDARHLPSRPLGRAELEARDLERGNVYLRELDLNAANREDGKIAVTMRSRPRTSPWLVEADALVTPGDTVTIDLERHRIRAGNNTEWSGTTGQIAIAPTVITVRDIVSASSDGKLSIAGHMHRVGRQAGDLKAQVNVDTFDLSNLSKYYRGQLQARVDVERTNGRFAGIVDLDATGIALDPNVLAFDADAKIEARADKLVVDANLTSPRLGKVALDVDIDAPKDITNAVAWKKLHRHHIRSARLQLDNLHIGRLAEVAKVKGDYDGRIDGDVQLSPTTTGGVIQLREVKGPALKNLGPLSANLTLSQTAPDELTPTLIATIDDRRAAGTTVQKPLAKVEVQATLGMPGHLFDPAAWQQLGKRAFKGGSMRVEDVMIEPPLLDRIQVTTNMRGRASFVAELAPAMENAKLQLDVTHLRGKPIALPVNLNVLTTIDSADTTTTMTVASMQTKRQLFTLDANIPMSLAEWIKKPQELRTAPLKATAKLPNVPAKEMLETFGRTQITGGQLTGTIDVAGTVGKPTVRARLAATNMQVPPGPRNTPIRTVERISLDASWDGTAGKVALDGVQGQGMLSLLAQGDPKQLEQATVSLVAKQFDLMPLLVFAPGPAGGAAGRLDAKLDVKGLDPRTAKIAGELHVTQGRIPIAPQVGTLRRAKVDVVVGEQLRVDVDGRLGSGSLKANATLGMEGAMPTGGDARITLRKVSPIGVVEPDIDADITAKLQRRADAWVADLTVARGTIKVPDGRGEALKPVGKPDDMIYVTGGKAREGAPKVLDDQKRPERPTFIANIHIKPTYIESNEMRGYVRGNLRIERDAEALAIVGKIEADRGNLELFGRRYQLDRAVVRFDGSTDPLLDVLITHDFPEVTTRTQVRGRLSKPELIMTSDPGTYSQGQLLGFLLGGEPEGQPADGNPRDKAASAGASIIANQIGGYVKDALPIDVDVLRYESATSSSGAAITVGTWITRSLFIAYRRRIEARPDENAGEGEIEYWLTRRVVVEGIVGDRGYNGVDLLWRKRY